MNKRLVVSGGSKGIGRAIIQKFARYNFDVVTCARDEKPLKKLKDEVEKTGTGCLRYCVTDMSVNEQVDRFGHYVRQQGGPVTVLVNNVGHFVPGNLSDADEGALEKSIAINLFSAYRLTRALLSDMEKGGKGHIFFLCSVASLASYPDSGIYTVSKFALRGLAMAFRRELMDKSIRVTAVMPGATRTASWDGTSLPDERFMPPEDIADTLYSAYALSPQSVVEEIILRPQQGDI